MINHVSHSDWERRPPTSLVFKSLSAWLTNFRRPTLVRALLLTVLCFPLVATADNSVDMNNQLTRALYSVLSHNDLSDIDALSKSLGLGLHVLKAEDVEPKRKGMLSIRAIPTRSPSYLFATGLTYVAYVDTIAKKTHIELRFVPRACPNLRRLGEDWNLPTRDSELTDGAGFDETMHWPGPEGIDLTFTNPGMNACSATFTQVKNVVVSFPKPPKIKRSSAGALVRQVVDLAVAGDLRDYHRSARILHTEFYAAPEVVRRGRLYHGDPLLGRVISGTDACCFSYHAEDSGWVAPPSFFAEARHLAERTVGFTLWLDTQSVCAASSSIESELRRRSVEYRTEVSRKDSVTYSVTGENLVRISANSVDSCITSLSLYQITDIAHRLKTPVLFAPEDAVDIQSNSLNAASIEKIDAVVQRVKHVRLREIDLEECFPGAATDVEKELIRSLSDLIKNAFVERGIRPKNIKTELGAHKLNVLEDNGHAFVFLDVLVH